MKFPCFPRMPGRRSAAEGPAPRGAVSLVVVFLFFVFSGLGLSVIYLSQIYLKLNAWRKFSTALDYASENGVKQGFQDIVGLLRSRPPLAPLPLELLESLKSDPQAALPSLLEELIGASLPRAIEETWENLGWTSRAEGSLLRVEDRGSFFRVIAGIHIEAEGMMSGLKPRRASGCDVSVGFIAGHLPLPAIPFFIKKNMDADEKREFLAANDISLVRKPGDLLRPEVHAADEDVIPGNADALTAAALRIQVFLPQDLPASRLRAILGLEPVAEPVPDGVYLIRDDLGLGGIFVQGDLEEMVLAIEDEYQILVFRMAEGEWTLRFSPALSRTEFVTPGGAFSSDLVPLGIVIVNGRIGSLCGGAVGTDGSVVRVTDGEIPAVLSGVALTIVASEEITLTSHLILQNVRRVDGIPYVKDSKSQLVIFSSGRDAVSGEDRGGGIAVGGEAPAELKIHASLTAAGGGIEIRGEGKTVELLGGLQTVAYKGNGNSLDIVPDARGAAGDFPGNPPLTATPQLAAVSLNILTWREF